MDYTLRPIEEEIEDVVEEPVVDQAIPDPEDPAPAPAPASAPVPLAPAVVAPAPVIPEVTDIPEVTFEADKPKLTPIDEEFEDVAEAPPPPPPKEEDSWLDPKDYAAFRGAAEGFSTLKGGKEFLTVLDMSLGDMTDEEKLAKILAEEPAEAPSEWDRREPSFTGVESFGEAWTYFLEAAGSGVTSTIPSVVGGAAGAALGGATTVNPIGATIGAFAGAATPSMALGLSGMYNDLRSNEGVRKALQDGTLTVDQFQRLVMVGGVITGGLDAINPAKVGKGLGIQAAKDAVRDTFIKAAIKGSFEEGATEGLQQITSEVAQSQGGGDTSLKQQAINTIDSILQGAIGGLVFGAAGRPNAAEEADDTEGEDVTDVENTGEATVPKADDAAEVAAPIEEEGTSSSTEDAAAAGTDTPGNENAATPNQPAGTPKAVTPAPAEVPTVDPAIKAALGITEDEELDPEDDVVATPGVAASTDVLEQEGRIRDLFRQENERAAKIEEEKARVKAAGATKVAKAGEDVAAAMAARATSPAPEPAAAAPQVPTAGLPPKGWAPAMTMADETPAAAGRETLGTGQALNPIAAAAAPDPLAAAADLQPLTPAGEQAQPEAPQTLPAASVSLEAAPAKETLDEAIRRRGAPESIQAGPTLTPIEEEVEDATPEEIAAFNTKAPELERAPDIQQIQPQLERAPDIEPAVNKGEQLKRKAAEKKVAPVVTEETKATPVKSGTLTLKSTAGVAPAPAAAPKSRKIPKAPVVAKAAPVVAKAAPAPGAKGAALKAKVKGKTAYVAEPEKVVPITGETTIIRKGDLERKPEPAPEPKVEDKSKAVRTNLSRDIAAHARGNEELQKSTVSDPAIKREFLEALEDAAAEHVRDHHNAAARGDLTPRQYIEREAKKITGRVMELMAATQAANDEANVEAKEYLSKSGRKDKETKARQDAMAHAESGQEKERAGKHKGKSAAGIRAEKVGATEKAYIAEFKKKPEQQDKHLLEWGPLREEQKKLGKRDAAGRAALQERLDKLQEDRAVAAELREGEGRKLSERATEAERVSAEAIEAVELPRQSGTVDEQHAAVNKYFEDFLAATKALVLHPHHDTKTQSSAENLVIYARKVEKNLLRNAHENKATLEGIGPTDFIQARMLYEAGAIDEMNDMVVSEALAAGGYSEALGKAPEQAWTEDEDVGEQREHESEAGYEPLADIDFMRRGREKTRGDYAKEEKADQKARSTSTVSVYGSNGRVKVNAETERASSVLRKISKWTNDDDQKGFWAVLRNAHIRQLMKLVGDVEVHFINNADMERIAGDGKPGVIGGVYMNYTNAARANGYTPAVFINLEGNDGRGQLSHSIIHELTHAATSQALRDGVRGTNKILDAMLKNMRHQLLQMYSEQELRDKGLWYAFTDESEFLAEAFSNRAFQEMMAQLLVPAKIRAEISALGKGRAPTWWDAFTATVSNAIGMISGQRGQTYMEQVIKLSPHTMRSSSTQQFLAHREFFGPTGKAAPRPTFEQVFAPTPLIRQTQEAYDAVKSKVSDSFAGKARWRDRFATTGELIRRAQNLGDNFGKALEKLARVHLRRDNLLKKYRDNPGAGVDNNKIQRAILKLMRQSKDQFNKAGHLLDDMTRWQVNATVPLAHADNKHISKAGQRGQDSRKAHADLATEFAALSPEAQAVVKDVIDHYKKTFKIENEAKIRNSLRQILKGYHKQLPAGKTLDDAVAWAMGPGPKRDAANQTAEDKLWHAALGSTAKTVGAVTGYREIKGVYAPMRRKGRLFISVKELPFGTFANQKNVPAGALIDAVTPEEKEAPNRLLFTNRADYDAFTNSTPYQVTGTTRWIDPKTGGKVPHDFQVADPSVPGGVRHAKKLFVATVQTNRLEMSDSKSKLDKRARELLAQGHLVSAMRITKRDLHRVVEEISPAQIKALIGNLEQTTLGHNTSGQQAIKGAILDAQVRMMNTPGRLERHLKRRNVLGNETDIFDSMVDYNRGLASALTNYELGPEMAEADNELELVMRADAKNRYNNDTAMAQQGMSSELRGRIADTKHVSGPKILSVVKDITFLRHLASPHYTIIQLTQPFMMTMPVLSSKYGRAAAWKELMRVMYMGGVRRSLGKGMKETWKGLIHLNPYTGPKDAVNMDEFWKDVVKNEPDASLLRQVIDSIVELGYGASSGIEAADVGEVGMNRGEIFLKRMVDMARALPESAESVNRYSTAIATVRLAKRKGMTDAEAIREAVLTVEETQGGYAAANNPAFFNQPWLAPATQFRKFSLAYGQLFYRNLAWSMRHADPEQKKIARKTVMKLALTTVATAGVYGLAPVEIARHLVNIAAMLGFKDDDWEEDENQIQEWFAQLTSEGFSEALFRGAPRLANLDLSGSLGVDNLAMFGQPEELSSEGIYQWLAKAAAGAPGAMAFKAFDGYQNGDIMEAIPWPKFIKSLIEAKDLAFTGTTDKKTGEQYMEPLGVIETVYKGLGFRTASEAREVGGRGSGYESRQDKQARYDRRILMGRWSNASPSEQRRIFREEVREWNREHRKDDDLKIDMGALHRSKKERKRREKERQRD